MKAKSLPILGLLLTVVTFSSTLSAQENPEQPNADKPFIPEKIPDVLPGIRGGFKLPTIMGNRSFRKALEGVGNFEFYYHRPVIGILMIGGGLNSSYYDINFTALPELSNGDFLSAGAFGLIGIEKFVSPRFYLTMHQKVGYQMFRFKTSNCIAMPGSAHDGSSLFIETQAGIFATATERLSVGLLIGYQYSFFDFGPQWVCRNSFSGLVAEDYVGPGRIINVGFGFSAILGKLP